MTPALYRKLAERCWPYRSYIWIVLIVGILLCAMPILAAYLKYSYLFIDSALFFGAGIIIIAWGIWCAGSWYLKTESGVIVKYLKHRFPGFMRRGASFLSWYSAIFLTVWFIFGMGLIALGVVVLSCSVLVGKI
ncbi:hypothetical protein K8T06_01270 [bacterium]|nr:hypothetical protein [bacterium]